MILVHLDTNYLIGLPVRGSAVGRDMDSWRAARESLAASAIAWTEFLNGPLTPLAVSRAEAVLESRIFPFGKAEAVFAAELFNKTGRRAVPRLDCLVCATARLAQAETATVNQSDFKVFGPHGLKLAVAPPPPLPPPPPPSPPQTAGNKLVRHRRNHAHHHQRANGACVRARHPRSWPQQHGRETGGSRPRRQASSHRPRPQRATGRRGGGCAGREVNLPRSRPSQCFSPRDANQSAGLLQGDAGSNLTPSKAP